MNRSAKGITTKFFALILLLVSASSSLIAADLNNTPWATRPADNDNAAIRDLAEPPPSVFDCNMTLIDREASQPTKLQQLHTYASYPTANYINYENAKQFVAALETVRDESRINSLRKSLSTIPRLSILEAIQILSALSAPYQMKGYEFLKIKISFSLIGQSRGALSQALTSLSPVLAVKIWQEATKFMGLLAIEEIAVLDATLPEGLSEELRPEQRTHSFLINRWNELTITDINKLMGFPTQGPLTNFLAMARISDFDVESMNMLFFSIFRQMPRNPFVSQALLTHFYLERTTLFLDRDIPLVLETLSNYPLVRQQFLKSFFKFRNKKIKPAQIKIWAEDLELELEKRKLNDSDGDWANKIKLEQTKSDLVSIYVRENLKTISVDDFKTLIIFISNRRTLEEITVTFITTPGKVSADELSDYFVYIQEVKVHDAALKAYFSQLPLTTQNIFNFLQYAGLFDTKPGSAEFKRFTIESRAARLFPAEMITLISGQYREFVSPAAIENFLTARGSTLGIGDAAQIIAAIQDPIERRPVVLKFIADHADRFRHADKSRLVQLLQ